MGSLMAGWDAPVKDPKTVWFQRNKSLTREQIEAYWKTKNQSEEEQLKRTCSDINKNQENIYQVARERFKRSNTLPLTDMRENTMNSSLELDQENIFQVARERFKRSNTLPLTDMRESTVNSSLELDAEMLSPTKCWWTRSNWAFLNESPVTAMEGPSYKYASQYHVTDCRQNNNEKLEN